MNAPFSIRTRALIAITGCMVAVSVNVHALSVTHHGLNVDSTDVAACIGCHDGTIGKAVNYCTVGCNFSTAHPVFKHYPPVGKRERFNSIASVRARGGRFVKNKVVCISCHNLSNQKKYHLVIDNNEGSLCLVCHIK
jgi:hypothetical protein